MNEGPFSALVIGASFGGPKAVEAILREFPSDFALPIAIVQHTGPGMTGYWASNLSGKTSLRVIEAEDRQRFEPGYVYIAPAGSHIGFVRGMSAARIKFTPGQVGELHVPSVNRMFESAARTFGSRTLAVLLTGLGSDGAPGMLKVRQAGGYTITESAETALSHSMPGSALDAGAVVEQLPLPRIAARLIELGKKR